MFIHIFKNRIKCLLRDKPMMFWTTMFPIILATLFNFAFSGLRTHEDFNPIPISIVKTSFEKTDATLLKTLTEESSKLFYATQNSEEESLILLKDNKVDGIIYPEKPARLVIKSNGLNQTIIKIFLDSYLQTNATVNNIIKTNPLAISQGLLEELSKPLKEPSSNPVSTAKPDPTIVYFYALLAMTCMYGGFFGVREINDIQADLSPIAARINMVPVPKFKVFVYRTLAAFLIQFSSLLILIAYLILFIKVPLASNLPLILLASFCGSLVGLSLGLFIGTMVKGKEQIKTAALIGLSMISSFLAGLMISQIKYVIANKAPITQYINPASLISDAFYSLYFYDTLTKFYTNIFIMLTMSAILMSISFIILSSRQYKSI